jgi:ribosomal protein L37AE/L43A
MDNDKPLSMSMFLNVADYWQAMYQRRETEAHELSEQIIRLRASHAAEVEALRGALIAARDHIACSVCHHDETQRRGLIWTECLQCGGMFADDQGGVPAPKEPAVLAVIRAALKGD